MRGWRAVRGGAALTIVAVAAFGCAQILGLPDETASLAADFCKCDQEEDLESAWPGETCLAHVEGRLATASPEQRAAWLETYRENDCGTCANHEGRLACKSTAPICAAVGASCQSSEVCCVPAGQEVYCGDQNVCVSEQNCTPPFASCDVDAPNCCGQAGFKGGCVEGDNGAYCLEHCNPEAPVNCPKCCAFFGQKTADETSSSSLCVPDDQCSGACDPLHGDPCPLGFFCHPDVERNAGTIYTVDACLAECDPDAPDSCGPQACCVRYRDLSDQKDVGRCVPQGHGTCSLRCGVLDDAGVPDGCSFGVSKCSKVDLPVGPGGPFAVYLCSPTAL